MKKNLTWLGVPALWLCAAQAHASGFALIEHSASGIGNSFAGGAAIADDATTNQFNPAGLTELQGREVIVGVHIIAPDIPFTNKGSTAATGGALTGPDGNGRVTAYVPNFYYSASPTDHFSYGLGISVPFGLTTNYDDNWVGRYHGIKSDMRSLNINPNIAWRLNDAWSIGAGLDAEYVELTLTSAIDFGGVCLAQELGGVLPSGTCAAAGLVPQQSDGIAKITGSNWSYGWNLGVLYRADAATRYGFSYRSQITQKASGKADFTVPANAAFLTTSGLFTDTNASANVTMPDSASISAYHAYNDRLALMADLSWTNWSVFQELRFKYANSAQPDSYTTENWKDTFRLAIGANYRTSPTWLWRTGLSYDQSPIPDAEHRTSRMPGSNRPGVAIGFGWTVTEHVQIDAGYSHLFVDKADLNNKLETSVPTINHTLTGTVNGSVDIFSVQVKMDL